MGVGVRVRVRGGMVIFFKFKSDGAGVEILVDRIQARSGLWNICERDLELEDGYKICY